MKAVDSTEAIRSNILDVAAHEFSEKGLAGARVDAIVGKLRGSKQGIYYYFGNKEQLYTAVLEDFYSRLRRAERVFVGSLKGVAPWDAITAFVGFNFDWHVENENGVRLTMIENMHLARHLSDGGRVECAKTPAIDVLADLLKRGAVEGVVRRDVDPLGLYLSMTALCFCNVSNRYTAAAIFGHETGDASWMRTRRAAIIDMIMRSIAV